MSGFHFTHRSPIVLVGCEDIKLNIIKFDFYNFAVLIYKEIPRLCAIFLWGSNKEKNAPPNILD